jgi:hypothetical protein
MIAVKQPGRPSLSGPPRDLLVAAGEQGGTSPVLRLRRLSGSTARAIPSFRDADHPQYLLATHHGNLLLTDVFPGCGPARAKIRSLIKTHFVFSVLRERAMPRQAQPKVDRTILEMAIVGYQSQLEGISAKIADIKAQLGSGRPRATASETDHAAPAKRRTMSKAGRARIAAAQRARWAAQKRQQEQPEKPKKRKFSAAGLRAIREGTKRRWAAYRKAHGSAA